MNVDTVFVIPVCRGLYPVEDLLAAIQWTCRGTHHTITVDRRPSPREIIQPAMMTGGHSAVTMFPSGIIRSEFLPHWGIKWAIDNGITCKQFVVMSDDCLITGQGLDEFLLGKMTQQGLGLFGVRDRFNYDTGFQRCAPHFAEWDLPQERFVPDGHTLHEAFLALSSEFALKLFEKNLLANDGWYEWPLPYGPFLSWTAQMLGFSIVSWGEMDRPMPPLYVNHTERSRHQPPPHILHPSFMLYYSVRHVLGHMEEELREAYKRARGEPAKQQAQQRPKVSPQRDGPTVLG